MYSIRDTETGQALPICFTNLYIANGGMRPGIWIPESWSCDPCAPASERYEVQHPSGMMKHGWWEVILVGYDDDQMIKAKAAQYEAIEKARAAVYEAERTLRELTR